MKGSPSSDFVQNLNVKIIPCNQTSLNRLYRNENKKCKNISEISRIANSVMLDFSYSNKYFDSSDINNPIKSSTKILSRYISNKT